MTRLSKCSFFSVVVCGLILCAGSLVSQERLLPIDTMNYAARIPLTSKQSTMEDSLSLAELSGVVIRIQILTTTSFAQARMASRVAQELFDQPVSVDFESPNFKVRVGRFPSNGDATQQLDRIRQAGFSNPIVVSQTILHRADSTQSTSAGQTVSPE
jgi:hypothetical protein